MHRRGRERITERERERVLLGEKERENKRERGVSKGERERVCFGERERERGVKGVCERERMKQRCIYVVGETKDEVFISSSLGDFFISRIF